MEGFFDNGFKKFLNMLLGFLIIPFLKIGGDWGWQTKAEEADEPNFVLQILPDLVLIDSRNYVLADGKNSVYVLVFGYEMIDGFQKIKEEIELG